MMVLSVLAGGGVATPRAGDSKSVLIIEQEDMGRAGFASLMSGLRQTLSTNLSNPAILYTENLDLARFDSPKYRDNLEKWFRTKYRGRSLDAIVAGGESSLEMVLNLRAELWPKVPVVFVGINEERWRAFAGRGNFTGISVGPDVLGTLSAGLRLCPDTRTIAFVASEHGYTQLYRHVAEEIRGFTTNRFDYISLEGLTVAETKQRLATLPPHSIVLYLSIWMDGAGQVVNPRDVLMELAEASVAPIFGISDDQVGYGIVGGSCINFSKLGAELGARLSAVLKAGNAEGIPVVRSGALQLLFDWRQLSAHRLEARRLPEGAEVHFQPPGLWETHRKAVVFVTAALILQTGLIGALLFQSMRRRRAEKSLAETQERMALAVQAAGLGIWTWQANADGPDFDLRCRRLCGFGTENPMGRRRGCPGVDAKVCPMLADAIPKLSTANPTFEVECPHGEEEGKLCWIASRGRGYFDKQGKLQRVIGISMDVTERKTAARALQEQREQLAHFDRVSMMGQLASSLAHELNQPLGAILRNTEAAELFLQQHPPDLQEAKAILADIRKDNERAGAVIDRMRVLLKRRQVQLAPQSLPDLVREVLSMVQGRAQAHQIQLVSELAPDLPLVLGDRVQLQQVLLNLLLNAIDAIVVAPGPVRRVEVRASTAAGFVEISVSDNGPGISPGHLPRVFEPFFTTKQHGMGVGLPISRAIIDAHNGRMWAENNVDGGAVFHLCLPCCSLPVPLESRQDPLRTAATASTSAATAL